MTDAGRNGARPRADGFGACWHNGAITSAIAALSVLTTLAGRSREGWLAACELLHFLSLDRSSPVPRASIDPYGSHVFFAHMDDSIEGGRRGRWRCGLRQYWRERVN